MGKQPSPVEPANAVSIQPAMSVPDAARRLGIGRTALYSLLSSGALPSYQIGRRRLLDPADVERFWESCRCPVTHSLCATQNGGDTNSLGNGSYGKH